MSGQRAPDALRSAALAAAAAALVGVPTLGPLLAGTEEDAGRYDTAITPPGYAFVIWAPIFAGCVANAAQHAAPTRSRRAENRAIGWPLAGAYALNAAWSVAAQRDRFGYTPGLLCGAVVLSALAHHRLQAVPPEPADPTGASRVDGIAPASTGLLLGWTSLAATVNLSAATQLLGADPTSPTSVAASSAGALGAAAAVSVLVTRSRRGFLPVAAASTWGLVTTALDRKRTTTTRLATAVSAAVVVISTVTALLRRRSRLVH